MHSFRRLRLHERTIYYHPSNRLVQGYQDLIYPQFADRKLPLQHTPNHRKRRHLRRCPIDCKSAQPVRRSQHPERKGLHPLSVRRIQLRLKELHFSFFFLLYLTNITFLVNTCAEALKRTKYNPDGRLAALRIVVCTPACPFPSINV